jgi:hypothetical protein
MRNAREAFVVIPNCDPAPTVIAALARACALLKAGRLAEAAKWAAVAASRGEAEALSETA